MFAHSGWGYALAALAAVTALCFVLPFHIRKPRSRELILFLLIGVALAIVLLLTLYL